MKRCLFCGVDSARVFGIEVRQCRCGGGHFRCRDCWKKRAKIVGEFPDQDYKLDRCPPENAGVRR